MENLNAVMLAGNLAREPELRETQSGFQILQFTLCTTRTRKNGEGVWEEYPIWTECKMFGARAASLKQYLHKGTRVYVIGELNQEQWTENATGSKRSKHVVEVRKIEFSSPRIQQAPTEDSYSDEDIPF